MSFHFKSFAIVAAAATALAACQPTTTTTTTVVSANKNVLIVNNTGRTIWRFYGSPTNVNSWEEDILGADILPAGQRVNVNFADGRSVCSYDMKAEFQDGTSIVKNNINVCAVSTVSFP
ncbi:hypothetical protein [Pseudooctadecabacter sp.]|uniref:hypothetical protein n=1 Tax=Pseudooctadecabacter sp. TaxID=1966338 RepID=UPI0035C7F893